MAPIGESIGNLENQRKYVVVVIDSGLRRRFKGLHQVLTPCARRGTLRRTEHQNTCFTHGWFERKGGSTCLAWCIPIFWKMARSRSRSPVRSIFQTWRAKQMHWERVRWELRHHVKSFHALRDSRDSLDALLRRYFQKTKQWSMADRTDLIMRHACHVAAWIAFGECAVEWAGRWALASQCFQGQGSFPERTDSHALRWNWLNRFWITRIWNQESIRWHCNCAARRLSPKRI